jgi:hypothetical protein
MLAALVWHKSQHVPEAAKVGGDIEKQGADLKVVRPSARKDKQWLARSDHCFTQFAALHQSAVDTYIDVLAFSKSKVGSIPLDHVRNLLLLYEHDDKTPISDAERARLTGAYSTGPRLRSGPAPTSVIGYAPLP